MLADTGTLVGNPQTSSYATPLTLLDGLGDVLLQLDLEFLNVRHCGVDVDVSVKCGRWGGQKIWSR